MHLDVTVPATLEAVSRFSADLEGQLATLPMETRTTLVLAIQELLVNIVEHAYAGAPGNISVKVNGNAKAITFQIEDQAPSTFQMPDEAAVPDPFALPESGLGLYIIEQAFDAVHHQQLAVGNRWSLTKNFVEA